MLPSKAPLLIALGLIGVSSSATVELASRQEIGSGPYHTRVRQFAPSNSCGTDPAVPKTADAYNKGGWITVPADCLPRGTVPCGSHVELITPSHSLVRGLIYDATCASCAVGLSPATAAYPLLQGVSQVRCSLGP